MKFEYTIPNFLTIFRVLLVPLIILLILYSSPGNLLAALLVYGLSAITDALDGYLARKLNQSSEFGAYFDPIADKILVWSLYLLFCFKTELMIPFFLVIFIYIRDIFITFLRNYSKRINVIFKTSFIAKAKTMIQMNVIALILIYMLLTEFLAGIYKIPSRHYEDIWKYLIGDNYQLIIFVPLALTIITVLFTIYTGVDYYLSFKKIKDAKNG